EGSTLPRALAAAIAGLAAQANGERIEITASQLEVAVLERRKVHRTFRRLTGSRLESVLADIAPAGARQAGTSQAGATGKAKKGPASQPAAEAGQAPADEPAAPGQEPADDDGAPAS